MDGSFIPPPFPFPEAWPRVFTEQQQRQERRWLTPTTFGPAQWQTPITAENYYYPVGETIPAGVPAATVDAQQDKDDDDDDDDDDDEDGEYEYGYVLSNEWRDRFQSSAQLQELQRRQQQKRNSKSKKRKPQKKKIKQQRQTTNAGAVAAASASRSGHLQREIQAAKTRELARKWKRRGDVDASSAASMNPQIEALETSLNMLFDEFCDAFQPVVWPHDPLQ